MRMRDWRGSVRRRCLIWLMDKRNIKVLMVAGLLLAGISVVIAISLVTDHAAPWLPDAERDDNLVPQLATGAIAGGLVGFLAGWAKGMLEERHKRRSSAPGAPRPTSALGLGVKWMFEGWRLWTFGLATIVIVALYVAALFVPGMRERAADAFSGDMVLANFLGGASLGWALILKGRELRRGKEQIKVAEEYLAIREARLHDDFNAMWHKRLEQQHLWEAEKTAQLYEQILDQQARGLLPCPNCSDRGDQRKSA
jgi:hypothetical protein